MSISSQIRARIASPPAYVCEACGKTYDRDRINCPACGFDVVPRGEDR